VGLTQAIKKRALRPLFSKSVSSDWVPGQGKSRYPGDIGLLLGLLLRLGLLRLLRLLRFLSHSILSGFNGLNATPRHAWRRASLATSSITNSADSRAAAACCHVAVITLSTAVVRFRHLFREVRHDVSKSVSVGVMLNVAQTPRAPSSSIQNHSTDWQLAGQSPLSGADASSPQDNGDCRRRSASRAGGSITGEARPKRLVRRRC
jgi:hypothetical protein